MDNLLHYLQSVGWKYLYLLKLHQGCDFGKDTQFYPTSLGMWLGLKLIHISKSGPSEYRFYFYVINSIQMKTLDAEKYRFMEKNNTLNAPSKLV